MSPIHARVASVAYYLDRALARLTGAACRVHLYRLLVQPGGAAPRLPERWRGAVAVRPAAGEEAEALAIEVPAAEIRARFARGDAGFAAWHGGRAIGHLWLSLGPYDETEVRCRFRPAPEGLTAWDYDLYIAPDHRGGPAFAALWDAADAWLRATGRRWTASRVAAHNAASLAAHRRLGARVVGSAAFVKIGPCQLTIATVRPFLHLALRRAHRPTITVIAPGR